jgi:GINS complex subunit 4
LHNERLAPELLPFQFRLIDSISKQLGGQEKKISTQANSGQITADDKFYLNIRRMEVERVKFALKSYLRTRLAKIEKHLLYIIEKDCSELLSEAEMQFAF